MVSAYFRLGCLGVPKGKSRLLSRLAMERGGAVETERLNLKKL